MLVDENYAGKVFDVAQKLILESDVNVSADTTQDSAFRSLKAAGAGITVNPNLVGSIYAHEGLGGAYDGFWVLLHELFHRAQDDIFEALALAQNETILKDKKESEKAVYSGQTDEGWRRDPENGDVGVHESFVNILRFGYGLRKRTMYGDNDLQDTVVSAETEDMLGRKTDPPPYPSKVSRKSSSARPVHWRQ
nr:hypothetical protein [Enhygromyxa salina]